MGVTVYYGPSRVLGHLGAVEEFSFSFAGVRRGGRGPGLSEPKLPGRRRKYTRVWALFKLFEHI